jgi:hypothetical protein
MTFEEMEEALRARLKALPSAARAELLHVLILPDFERADRITQKTKSEYGTILCRRRSTASLTVTVHTRRSSLTGPPIWIADHRSGEPS